MEAIVNPVKLKILLLLTKKHLDGRLPMEELKTPVEEALFEASTNIYNQQVLVALREYKSRLRRTLNESGLEDDPLEEEEMQAWMRAGFLGLVG